MGRNGVASQQKSLYEVWQPKQSVELSLACLNFAYGVRSIYVLQDIRLPSRNDKKCYANVYH